MFRLNVLLIYSNEKERQKLREFLKDQKFPVNRSFHAIEDFPPLDFYPDVAIIQTAIFWISKVEARIKETFPFANIVFVKSAKRSSDYDELKEILEKKKLFKRQRFIEFIKQIGEKPFYQNSDGQGNKFYELQLT